jgi:hypothetical protein
LCVKPGALGTIPLRSVTTRISRPSILALRVGAPTYSVFSAAMLCARYVASGLLAGRCRPLLESVRPQVASKTIDDDIGCFRFSLLIGEERLVVLT